MSAPDAGLVELFRDETARRLDEMDAVLLAIESGDAGAEAVDSLFRQAHTIKGAAGMLGFDDIRALAYATEDVLAQVREANGFPPGLAAPLLRATRALRAQLTGSGTPAGDGHRRAGRHPGSTPAARRRRPLTRGPADVPPAHPGAAAAPAGSSGAHAAGSGSQDRPPARRGR